MFIANVFCVITIGILPLTLCNYEHSRAIGSETYPLIP